MSGCKITRPHLDKLWCLATEGFTSGALRRVATQRRAGELSSEFEASTIDLLIEAVRSATLPGDPETIDNLQLVISERGSVRRVSIVIDGHALGSKVEVSVVDENPGWVRGRIGGLRELFAETRNGWFVGQGRIRFVTAVVGFLAALPVNVMVASLLPFVHTIPARIVLFVGGLAILTSICYVFGHWMDLRSRTELRLHEPPKAKIDMGVWAIVVGIIGVLVAIVSSLASHHVFPPAHASGPGSHVATPGPFAGLRAYPGLGADSSPAGANPADAPGSQVAGPSAYPGLGAAWAQAGLSWVRATGGYIIDPPDPPAFPGLGAAWAQAGVTWPQTVGNP